jgi:transposase InsO family protein
LTDCYEERDGGHEGMGRRRAGQLGAIPVPRATSRAVCTAFLAALERFGVPEQVLTDNGIQFTGKYLRPRHTEVLFDQICRHNGIDHLLTKIRSPTTTGKIERWHQSIQTDHGPQRLPARP